jgi:hypothetical protein
MTTEIVYLGRDNRIDLLLKANGAAVDIASVTRMDLVVGAVTVTSANGSDDPIRWAQAGFTVGEVRMSLGAVAGLTPSVNACAATLVVFDANNPRGIVWGTVNVLVKD